MIGSPERAGILLAVFGLTALISFALPRPRHQNTDALPKLTIPLALGHWVGQDVSASVNIQDERYNFIGDVIVRQYVNDLGERLLLLVLDAGNFHHPKNCFKSSGFESSPVEDLVVTHAGRTIRAQAIWMEKSPESQLVVYWMCIEGRQVDWAGQKFTDLFYSLIGKQRSGFMGRVDIPGRRENIEGTVLTAKDFLKNLLAEISEADAMRLVGKSGA